MNKHLEKIAWVLAIVGLIIGLVGLYQRFSLGHQAAGYGSYVPWGLWIAAYTMLVGASAGAFGLAAAIFALRQERYYRLARLALLVALGAFIAGMVNVWLDLGHPWRFWKLFLQTSTSSVMGWMAWFYLLYGLLLVAGLWLTRRGVIPVLMQRLAFLPFLFAIVFAGAEGALFGVVSARAMWESGLTPVLFLVEGALFGLGLVAACAYLFGDLVPEAARRLGQVMLGLLGVLVVLEWAEFSTGLYAAVPAKEQALQVILSGPYWWVFWIFHLGLGVIVPGLLLLFSQGRVLPTAVAGALIGAMALTSKLNLVVPALAQEELNGLATAFSGPGLEFSYFPTPMEWMAWIGTVALGGLVVLIGYRVFALSRQVTGAGSQEAAPVLVPAGK